jgi:hypothetical protein
LTVLFGSPAEISVSPLLNYHISLKKSTKNLNFSVFFHGNHQKIPAAYPQNQGIRRCAARRAALYPAAETGELSPEKIKNPRCKQRGFRFVGLPLTGDQGGIPVDQVIQIEGYAIFTHRAITLLSLLFYYLYHSPLSGKFQEEKSTFFTVLFG